MASQYSQAPDEQAFIGKFEQCGWHCRTTGSYVDPSVWATCPGHCCRPGGRIYNTTEEDRPTWSPQQSGYPEIGPLYT
jgi:hypothetical protein